MNEVAPALTVALVALVVVLASAALYWYRTKGATRGGFPMTGLDPATQINGLGEQVKGLAGKLEELVAENLTNRVELSTKIAEAIKDIGDVYEQGKTLGTTTSTIATALQGSGQRGSWGELQLERVAELAGITKHVSFKWQHTFKDEEEKDKTPDMTVYLPGNRAIPVDAKAPDLNLDGEESTAADRLKDAIKGLSAKKYPDCVPGALDFVILFVPTESTLAAALSEDLNLIEGAYKQGVLLTSPLTLLGMLRAVEHGWQQDDQINNVAQINEMARELCNRVNNVIEHVAGIQKGLASAVESYNSAVSSMNSRLLVTVRQMENLGVAVAKEVVDLTEVPTHLSEPPAPLDANAR
jgi:DNA recombination protein RmuC